MDIGNPDPKSVIFTDDNLPNLEQPQKIGWNTLHLTADMDIIQEMRKITKF